MGRSGTVSDVGAAVARVAALAALFATAAVSGASAQAAPSFPTADGATIDADDLRRRIGVLAHDSMRGRDTPSPELELTAEYVADRFRSFGLRPGLGDGGFQQRYPLTLVSPGDAEGQRVRIRGPGGATRLDPGADFVAAPTGADAAAEAPLELWRAGDGGEPPEDALLLVPVTPQTIADGLDRVRDALRGSGAPGAILAVDADDEYFGRVRDFFSREQVSLGEPDVLARPVVLVRRGSLPGALQDALDGDGTAARDWRARLSTEATVEAAYASNTIGWLPGSDPDLRNEYVIFSAHMDHLGVGAPAEGDSIYNGADDDASGVAAVLEVAEAFARADRPPRRSVVFMTFSGEERGLLGSRWYSEHPVFGLDRTVAVLNVDMIGRNWRDTVAAIGKEMSSLGRTVEAVAEQNSEAGIAVVGDRWPAQNLFRRSDHYHLARKGVPALFFFSGLHEDYHRPSDELDDIDYGKTARIVRLLYQTGRAVADADERPTWEPDARDRVVEDGGRR